MLPSCPSPFILTSSEEQPNLTQGASSAITDKVKTVQHLTYKGRPGEDGDTSKLKIVLQCFQHKKQLFSQGKRQEVHKMVAEDLNKYNKELFLGQLKENSMQDWCGTQQ
jgi:hypothetical protein